MNGFICTQVFESAKGRAVQQISHLVKEHVRIKNVVLCTRVLLCNLRVKYRPTWESVALGHALTKRLKPMGASVC